MDDYEMDEATGLGGLPSEAEGEETANITDVATDVGVSPLGALDIQAKYGQAVKQYETSTQNVLNQIAAARQRLLSRPTEKSKGESLRGLATALTTPPERTDPRFYERKNLFTFLRDVGAYGAAEEKAAKEAKLKQEEDIARLDELKAKYEQQSALNLLKELEPSYRASMKPAAAAKEDEITRLQKVRDSLDIRDPRRAELTRRIAYLGGEREGTGQETRPGEKEVDKKVGAEYADWVIGGKGAQAASRISKINDVVSQLGKRKDISGAVVGYTLENFPTFASVLYPEAQDVKDVVESVVQTDLRAILGGQFAQQEGLALIKRAYNPRLDETKNANRLKLLARQMQLVADEKNRAMSYFGEKGTIKGYTFKPYSANDFLTSDQLRRIDAGESVESILGEAPLEKPKSESKPKPAVPSAGGAAKTPAQKAAEELARRRAAKGG